jgi:hypothetical protein
MHGFRREVLLLSLLLIVVAPPAAAGLPLCDFTPAESRLTKLTFQGNLQLIADPSQQDHPRPVTGTLQGSFMQLMDSPLFGYRLEAEGDLNLSPTGIDPRLRATSSFKRYFREDFFNVGALDIESYATAPLVADLTGGLGRGRFRDVTPLAKATRIQNSLLDQGALQGPFGEKTLQELAKRLAQPGASLGELMEQLEKLIEATGLVTGGELGAEALLRIEQIATSSEEARLCGWEVQASLGLEMSGFPPARFNEALVVSWDYALVPDPISQWTVSARLISGFRLMADHSLQASIFYGRRIGEAWRVRLNYTFTRDRTGNPGSSGAVDRHQLTGKMVLQLSPEVNLTMNGELIQEEGYRWPLTNITVQFGYEVF